MLLQLYNKNDKNNNYLWTSPTGSLHSIFDTNRDIIIDNEGVYKLRVVTYCNTIIRQIKVIKKDCKTSIYIPNAFTVNNDNLNDVYNIHSENYLYKKCKLILETQYQFAHKLII
jgi:hypothetical protein